MGSAERWAAAVAEADRLAANWRAQCRRIVDSRRKPKFFFSGGTPTAWRFAVTTAQKGVKPGLMAIGIGSNMLRIQRAASLVRITNTHELLSDSARKRARDRGRLTGRQAGGCWH